MCVYSICTAIFTTTHQLGATTAAAAVAQTCLKGQCWRQCHSPLLDGCEGLLEHGLFGTPPMECASHSPLGCVWYEAFPWTKRQTYRRPPPLGPHRTLAAGNACRDTTMGSIMVRRAATAITFRNVASLLKALALSLCSCFCFNHCSGNLRRHTRVRVNSP